MADLTSKTALVTGASRGIGRAIARRLAADGALVAVHYGSNDRAAKDTIAAIEAAGGQAFAVRAELGTEGDVDTLFAGLRAGIGTRQLDILVNNAGVGDYDSIEDVTPAQFDRVIGVNLRAPFFICQRAITILADGGRIVNISSVAARVTVRESLYAISKGAIDLLTRSLAQQLGPRGITVNTVAPGMTDTDMIAYLRDVPLAHESISSVTALRRLGTPEDIADAVAFLASDDGRWITGHLLDASGGLWLGPSA
jgi:NAD(P)-dependent dehydrogenase (short-subunit alcohol dehydrogenase family)